MSDRNPYLRDRRKLEGELGNSPHGRTAEDSAPLPGWTVWARQDGSWSIMARGESPDAARARFARLGLPKDTRALLMPGGAHPDSYKLNRRPRS